MKLASPKLLYLLLRVLPSIDLSLWKTFSEGKNSRPVTPRLDKKLGGHRGSWIGISEHDSSIAFMEVLIISPLILAGKRSLTGCWARLFPLWKPNACLVEILSESVMACLCCSSLEFVKLSVRKPLLQPLLQTNSHVDI